MMAEVYIAPGGAVANLLSVGCRAYAAKVQSSHRRTLNPKPLNP